MPLLKIRLYPADSEVPTFANGQTPHRAAERADARTCGVRWFWCGGLAGGGEDGTLGLCGSTCGWPAG